MEWECSIARLIDEVGISGQNWTIKRVYKTGNKFNKSFDKYLTPLVMNAADSVLTNVKTTTLKLFEYCKFIALLYLQQQ